MNDVVAYTAPKIFTGSEWLEDHVIIVEHNVITSLIPIISIQSPINIFRYDDSLIVPAFVDLQIYGAYEKLFSQYPESASLSTLVDYCRKGGAAYCMPTVATNSLSVFYSCIDAVKEYWVTGGKGVLGLHLEGPWINPVKKGAHIESFIHVPTLVEVKELVAYGKGVIKMITLAPEIVPVEITQYLLDEGITISAGHSNAAYEEANKAFSGGINAVTHLYNAMSPLQHRTPGLVGATLDHTTAMASIIADGHHVDYAAIRIAKAVMKERLFAITDAVTATDDGSYQHQLAGDKYESNGVLSGSALTMIKAMQNLVNHCGIAIDEALRMCSLYPTQVIGEDKRLGRIESGFEANLLVIDKQLQVVELI